MGECDTDTYRAEERKQREARQEKHASLWMTPGCRAGWFGLLDTYYETVRALLAPSGLESEFGVWQVKEKFGGLHIHSHASPRISEADRHVLHVAKRAAEDASYHVCEVCGGRGELRVRDGWFATRCEEHADGGHTDGMGCGGVRCRNG